MFDGNFLVVIQVMLYCYNGRKLPIPIWVNTITPKRCLSSIFSPDEDRPEQGGSHASYTLCDVPLSVSSQCP